MEILIQIDTREKTHAITHITKYFDLENIKYMTNKLPFGDYQNLHNPLIVVDKKSGITEVEGNITKQHERFRNELIKAQENGFKLIILIEEENVTSLDDLVSKYKNPRALAWARDRKRALAKGEEFKRRPPLSNSHIVSILKTMEEKYGVEFMFVKKRFFAQKLVELLTMEVK